MEHIIHTFEPVFDDRSRILILGSLPSVKSREQGFYYGHPQNRFWKLIAELTGETLPDSIDAKKALLLKHHIALWDVAASCDIEGSSDASIRNVVPNDINIILKYAPIERIYTNGTTAGKLYQKLLQSTANRQAITLPSTSPANAACSYIHLKEVWKQILS